MTRLKTSDICDISSRLETYNQELLTKTGCSLLGIACHAYGQDEVEIKHQIQHRAKPFCINIVPVTAGQGIITDFCETVAAILQFLGFNAQVSDQPDASGVAQAFENNADAIMMADDNRFVGINLKTQSVKDNCETTGRVFAAALDLMAKGINGQKALVLGCGPVGEAAARILLSFGARVILYDINLSVARLLKERLSLSYPNCSKIVIEKNINKALLNFQFIIEATSSINTILDKMILKHTQSQLFVAAPGVPLGISKKGCEILKNCLIHDKLELGVAGMAIALFLK